MTGMIQSDTVLLPRADRPLISSVEQCRIIEALGEQKFWEGRIQWAVVRFWRCDPEENHAGSIVCAVKIGRYVEVSESRSTAADAIGWCREILKSSAPLLEQGEGATPSLRRQ